MARWFTVLSEPVFAFAGIWRPVDLSAAYALLTCEPNPLVAKIYPKAMPVILHKEDYEKQLRADKEGICDLIKPYASQLMSHKLICVGEHDQICYGRC